MSDLGVYDERRFAPAVREWRGNHIGPTGQFQRHQQDQAEREAMVQLLWAEGWAAGRIADYLGLPRRWVRALVAQDGVG